MGSQQFASGMTLIDQEKINTIRDNTQFIKSSSAWQDKFFPRTYRQVYGVSPASVLTLASITGKGFFKNLYARFNDATTDFTNSYLEVVADGVTIFRGALTSSNGISGFVWMEEVTSFYAPNAAIVLDPYSNNALGVPTLPITGISGTNNLSTFSQSTIGITTPIYFNNSLLVKFSHGAAVSNNVRWLMTGGIFQ